MASRSAFGLVFRKARLLESALCHPSYRNENPCPPLDDFDRLEFFGDAILNFVICRRLYQLFPEANEGALSRMRSILVSRKILTRVAQSLRLEKKIRVGRSLTEPAQFKGTKIVSDCFEALVAAVYFDRGLAQSEKFILRHFRSYFDAKRLFRLDPNPKSTLQELALKNWRRLPVYKLRMTPKGAQVTVSVTPRYRASGFAPSRREAEEKAAKALIQKLSQSFSRRLKKRSPLGKVGKKR